MNDEETGDRKDQSRGHDEDPKLQELACADADALALQGCEPQDRGSEPVTDRLGPRSTPTRMALVT